MSTSPLDALTQRLDRLEQEIRWWRMIAGAALAILLFVGASPQPRAVDKVVAKEFVLIDEAGKARGAWRSLPDGSSILSLRDTQGTPRVMLGTSADGTPAFGLMDGQGTVRAFTGFLADNTPIFTLKDSQGKNRLGMNLLPEGLPMLNLQDAQGKALAGLLVGRDGLPSLMLRDAQGTLRVSLEVDITGAGLALLDTNRTMRAVFGAYGLRPESSALLFDKDGKTVWKAP